MSAARKIRRLTISLACRRLVVLIEGHHIVQPLGRKVRHPIAVASLDFAPVL